MHSLLAVGLLLISSLLQANSIAFVRKGAQIEEVIPMVLLETRDYIIYRNPESLDTDFANLYWINLEDALYDRFSIEQLGLVEVFVADNFAVLTILPKQLSRVAEVLHDERWACGQLIRLFGDEVLRHASASKAIPVIPVSERLEQMKGLHDQVELDEIRKTVEDMVALGTRHARSKQAPATTNYLLTRYRKIAGTRSDVIIETVEHANSPAQSSVVVRIIGRTRPDEIIILGSHIDSIVRDSGIAPGADDNASGTASHLEVFRTIISQDLHFARTVEIHGYAAEELGLLGSQDIARKYVKSGKKVEAMLQNDMNMFRSTDYDMIWLITNDSDPQLTADLEQLIKQYQKVAVNKGKLTAGTSDHRSWNRQGFPVAFPTENPNNYNMKIHSSEDTIAQSGAFTQSVEFVRLSLSFLVHFAGLETQVVQ